MVNLASAHVRSLNFGPDTGTVSCQFQQATGKSTMPSISKWSPVIICICLCSIPYCSPDWVSECTLPFPTQSNTRCATESSSVSPLVWSGQRPIGKELQGGSEGLSHSVKVSVRSNEKGRLCFSACVDVGRGPIAFLWRILLKKWEYAATIWCDLKEKTKNGVPCIISSSGSVSFYLWRIFGEWSKMLVPTSDKEMEDFFFLISSRARSVQRTTMNGNGGLPGFLLLILQNLLVIGWSPFHFKFSRGVQVGIHFNPTIWWRFSHEKSFVRKVYL